MPKRVLHIDLPEETVSFDKDDITVTEREHGISIIPKQDKATGFLRVFYPWGEVRRVREEEE